MTLTTVEPPRDRRRVAILLVRDCTAVLLRRRCGDGGATAVLVRYHGGHGGDTAVMAVPRRSHGSSLHFKIHTWPLIIMSIAILDKVIYFTCFFYGFYINDAELLSSSSASIPTFMWGR